MRGTLLEWYHARLPGCYDAVERSWLEYQLFCSSETRGFLRVPLKFASTCSRLPRISLGVVLSDSTSFSAKQRLLCHGMRVPIIDGKETDNSQEFQEFPAKTILSTGSGRQIGLQ